jgi:hypothetical protein
MHPPQKRALGEQTATNTIEAERASQPHITLPAPTEDELYYPLIMGAEVIRNLSIKPFPREKLNPVNQLLNVHYLVGKSKIISSLTKCTPPCLLRIRVTTSQDASGSNIKLVPPLIHSRSKGYKGFCLVACVIVLMQS